MAPAALSSLLRMVFGNAWYERWAKELPSITSSGPREGSGLRKPASVMVLGGVRAVLPLAAARDGVCALQGRLRLEAGQRPPRPPAGLHEPRALEDGAGQRVSVVSPRLRASRAKGGISAREI
jgi:hypothetical protein